MMMIILQSCYYISNKSVRGISGEVQPYIATRGNLLRCLGFRFFLSESKFGQMAPIVIGRKQKHLSSVEESKFTPIVSWPVWAEYTYLQM